MAMFFRKQAIALLPGLVLSVPAVAASFSGVSLQEIARFLAAKPLPADSKLKSRTRTAAYRRFARSMNNYWSRYRRNTVQPIRAFQREHLNNETREMVFYPFAGADFINMYLMYPKAKTYLMFGLEKAGGVPNISGLSPAALRRGLDYLVRGYNVFIAYNFYRTLGMQVYMSKSPLTGTVPHILCQMAWLGLKPVGIHRVDVKGDGSLTFTGLTGFRYSPRTAIDFEGPHGRARVIYLNIDVRNAPLSRVPRWKKYFRKLPACNGVLKAASYLTPRWNYTWIKGILLQKLQTIVQDDSGIPYRYLRKKWHITLFGRYRRAHKIFPSFSQPRLKAAYRRAKYRPLPFKFAYDRPNGWRNLMIARRK